MIQLNDFEAKKKCFIHLENALLFLIEWNNILPQNETLFVNSNLKEIAESIESISFTNLELPKKYQKNKKTLLFLLNTILRFKKGGKTD